MTLPEDWWTADLDDEPCDGCGVKPSKHAGHGSYTCRKCYEARWCPTCKYELRDGHVCVTPEQHAENERKTRYTMACIGDEDAVKSYEAELAALRARVAELEGAMQVQVDVLIRLQHAASDIQGATSCPDWIEGGCVGGPVRGLGCLNEGAQFIYHRLNNVIKETRAALSKKPEGT